MEKLEFEFNKISSAFERVKEDVIVLKREVLHVKNENKSVREKLSRVSNRKPKIKTITKTIIKRIGKIKHKIVGNSKTKKVHYSVCAHAKKLNEKSAVKFKTIKDALKQGYNRCSCIFNN